MSGSYRLRLLRRRLVQFIPVVLLSTVIVFGLMQLVPGDPAVTLAGDYATPERIQELRASYGFDRPLWEQYAVWLGNAVQGDLSTSLLSREEVTTLIRDRFPATILIAGGAVLLSLLIGVPLGMLAATRARTPVDAAVTGLSSLGVAVPNFWLAMILVAIVALNWQLLPATGAVPITQDPLDAIRYAILPALALAANGIAEVARQVRSALLEVLGSEYVRTLRAKGLPAWRIFWLHGLKNIGIPLLTVTGLLINRMLGATVVIEAVFAVPGIGSLMVHSAINKDFPVVQGVVFVMVIIVILTNLLIDLAYTLLDPRVGEK